MRDRTFGVEIEHNSPLGISGTANLFRHNGLQVASHYDGPGWTFGHDGSGIEARTPVLSGAAGFRELRKAIELIVDNGGRTNGSDGLHVHHGAPEFVKNPQNCYKLVKSWHENLHVIGAFVASSRNSSYACPHWRPERIEELKDASADLNECTRYSDDYVTDVYGRRRRAEKPAHLIKKYYTSVGPRGSINLGSLEEHGTVEFRLHEGTLDWTQIEAWIRFGQRFINCVAARKSPLTKVEGADELLRRVRAGKKAAAQLKSRATQTIVVPDIPCYDDEDYCDCEDCRDYWD